MDIKKLVTEHTLKCVIGGFIVGVIACGAGAGMSALSGTPTFCGSCHSMKMEQATFAESSHKNLDCVECHLPHTSMAVYYVEKGRTGMVDMYHEIMRDYPAKIKMSKSARDTVNANCLRCHSQTMENVSNGPMGTEKDCLKCHSRIAHGSNHLEGGIKIE
ncbi:MAG: cytochrome c3 family protein [Selenomonadaceae bacterium]